MTNILIKSDNKIFLADLKNQIKHEMSEYNIIDSVDIGYPDIIVIDENIDCLQQYLSENIKSPLFFLNSNNDNEFALNSRVKLLSKPFVLSEFIDNLHASINLYENSRDGYIEFNHYILRPINKDILNNKTAHTTKLTEKEVAILKYLYQNQDHIVDKEELLKNVWGYSPDVSTHTIETHIYRLRQKVEQPKDTTPIILTVDGGYKLNR